MENKFRVSYKKRTLNAQWIDEYFDTMAGARRHAAKLKSTQNMIAIVQTWHSTEKTWIG